MLTSPLRSGSRLSASAAIPPGGGGNSHPSISDHSPVSTEFQNGILNDAADQSGTLGPGNGTSRLLAMPFIVEDISDEIGPLLVVSPLKYFRFDRDSGCVVDHPVHAKPAAPKRGDGAT